MKKNKTISFYIVCSYIIISWLMVAGLLNAQTESIEKILNTDGTLKSVESGSYNATGYTIEIGENNVPKLINTERLNKEKGNSTVTWSSFGSGYNGVGGGSVKSIVVIGDNIYFGGEFKAVDDYKIEYIVKFNTQNNTWSALGNGVNGFVKTMVTDGINLFVGGEFTTAGDFSVNYLAKWDGNSWSALAPGLNGYPLTLLIDGSNLYVGGTFTKVGVTTVNRIARWDLNMSQWSALGSGMDNNVYALAKIGSYLYVGGSFASPGSYIAKWNGSSWSAVGSGLGQYVLALAVSGTDLYAGGGFTTAGGSTANRIAKWSTTTETWSALGSGVNNGVNNIVNTICTDGSNLYVGGAFTTAGGNSANCIAKWNGSSWSALGSGINDYAYAMALSGDYLIIGGNFSKANDIGANKIAKYNRLTTVWSSITSGGTNGITGNVYAIAVIGSDYYFAGNFKSVKGSILDANYIAKWNATDGWTSLGLGLNNQVNALAVIGTDLCVGGHFTTAGGTTANYIAKWNGSSWSALGSGLDGPVYALAVFGTNHYVGGNYYFADGIQVSCIAKWDGGSWSALGSGLELIVLSIALKSDTEIYVGCHIDYPYEEINAIHKWDGSNWSALGSGVIESVSSIAISGTDVYIGGEITYVGDNPTNYIAKWDGSNWTALGSGLNGYVKTLAVSGSDLYVGGNFTTAGGNEANYLAKWNGTSWSSLTEGGVNGLGGGVSCLLLNTSTNKMLVGGSFVTAGTKCVYGVTAFTDSDNPFPVELTTFSAKAVGGNVNLYWTTSTEINNYGFYLERKIDYNNWEEITFISGYGNSQTINEYSYTDNLTTGGLIQYRLKQVDLDGVCKYSSVIEVNISIPINYNLSQNYPNPFNPETRINYSISKSSNVKIVVFDALGKEVTTLVNENKNAGNHSVLFNAKNLTSGVYFYKIETGDFSDVKKMMVVK